jgi:hypothetical protein
MSRLILRLEEKSAAWKSYGILGCLRHAVKYRES